MNADEIRSMKMALSYLRVSVVKPRISQAGRRRALWKRPAALCDTAVRAVGKEMTVEPQMNAGNAED